jgi:hypothetical protein
MKPMLLRGFVRLAGRPAIARIVRAGDYTRGASTVEPASAIADASVWGR